MRWSIAFVFLAAAFGFASGTLARQGSLGVSVKNTADAVAEKVLPPQRTSDKPAQPARPSRTLTLTALKKGSKASKKTSTSSADVANATLFLGTEAVKVDALTTKQEQMKGYTNRKRPADDHGFLYVLDKPSRYAYWMKNMLFSTDVVWLDDRFRVIDLKASIAPETYPDQIFEPIQPASYMLEFPDGFIMRHRIVAGDTVDVSAFMGK